MEAKDSLTYKQKIARDIAQQSYNTDRKDVGEYNYLKNYSNDNTAVYQNRKSKKIKIGMRGSKTSGDWIKNSLIGVGAEAIDSDFKNDQRLYNTLKNDFSDSKISTTGHSRGGKRARSLAFNNSLKGDSFNEASSKFSITQAYQNNYCKFNSCNDYTSHRTTNDPVSNFNSDEYGTNKIYKPKGSEKDIISGHSLSNFY